MKTGTVRAVRNTALILAFLLGGVGVGGWLYAVRTAPPEREFTAPPPFVETMVVRSENVTDHFTGFGTAAAYASASVSAEVGSIVEERVDDVRAGVAVTAGQPLIRLDVRTFRYTLDQAVALAEMDAAALAELDVEERKTQQLLAIAEEEFRVATAEYERVGGLFEREQAAEKEMNVANLAYQAAKRVLQGYQRELALIAPRRERIEASRRAQLATAERARLDVARCTIAAPISGVVKDLSVDVGDRVAPGSPIATIVDLRRIEVPIRLPASSYADVRPGASCRLASESSNGSAWHGEVARIAPTIDEQTRTFAAYLVVDNTIQEHPLVPGMFVRAVVEGPTLYDVLLVPRGAIRGGHVFVAHDGLAQRRNVEVARVLGERAVIRAGVEDGESVILSNLDILAHGVSIRVAEGAPRTDDHDSINARQTAVRSAGVNKAAANLDPPKP